MSVVGCAYPPPAPATWFTHTTAFTADGHSKQVLNVHCNNSDAVYRLVCSEENVWIGPTNWNCSATSRIVFFMFWQSGFYSVFLSALGPPQHQSLQLPTRVDCYSHSRPPIHNQVQSLVVSTRLPRRHSNLGPIFFLYIGAMSLCDGCQYWVNIYSPIRNQYWQNNIVPICCVRYWCNVIM